MKLIIAIVLIGSTINVFGQLQITKIDSTVRAYNEQLWQFESEGMEEFTPHLTITSDIIKRAIGPVNHEITIYFDRHDEIVEDEESSREVYKATIRKVSFGLNTGSYTVVYDYYFDENGDFIYYWEYMIGYACYEKILHFDQGKCVKIKQKMTSPEDCFESEEVDEFERTTLNESDKKIARNLIRETEQFKKLLQLNYQIMMED